MFGVWAAGRLAKFGLVWRGAGRLGGFGWVRGALGWWRRGAAGRRGVGAVLRRREWGCWEVSIFGFWGWDVEFCFWDTAEISGCMF